MSLRWLILAVLAMLGAPAASGAPATQVAPAASGAPATQVDPAALGASPVQSAQYTLGAPAERAAIVAPQVGQQVSTRILFLDGTILLPPGQWVVAALQQQRVAEIAGSDVASIVLLQVTDGRVGAAVMAQGNVVALAGRPSLSSECWSANALFTLVAADDDLGGACAAVLPVAMFVSPGDPGAWDNALRFASAHGWQVPRGAVVAALRSVDRSRLMDVRYALAVPDGPMVDGGAPCAWTASPVQSSAGPSTQSSPGPSPQMARMAQGMTNFATAMLTVAEAAGHTDLPPMGPAPALLAPADAPRDLPVRLKQARIDELVENGDMSTAQADALSRRAAEPTPGDPLIRDLAWRSGYKTLTYKASAFIDTSAVYYFFVPDLPLVLVGSAITNVLGMPIVYINDFAWSYFGLRASRSQQPFALASLGNVCPKH